ncbi:MAG: tRNA uridine-5-carboxymethylaminomethyl(34) synthesis GTPase MnmE [Dechloromonas sp.]|nr:tRNA uridine-5-carboxymethylaminomethyl(34) synthesis GTPase MnmE [Dechloromonas sp.]
MDSPEQGDTIFALSSGRLPAGVAVIRVSGPCSVPVVTTLVGTLPEERQLALRGIRSRSGQLIDRGLVAVFRSPHSFTGEDCVELHLHGGPAVVRALLEELGSFSDVRHAEAGEFSLRAYRNGKFDLTTAEALADLIQAETEAQRRFALENSGGRNGSLYAGWREALLRARSLIEAELDFPDEHDVPGSVSADVWKDVAVLAREIDSHMQGYRRGEIIRDGYRVVIVGPPNAGKSSLLNALARRDVAIVSDEPGTTRDLVEVDLNLAGLKIIVTDTAGVREGAGTIEKEGIARARTAAAAADLILLLEEGSGPVDLADFLPGPVPFLSVRSKVDLLHRGDSRETAPDVEVSAVTGIGLSTLLDMISARAEAAAGKITDTVPFRERHVMELRSAAAALLRFAGMQDEPLELAAEQLRVAALHLARIIGAIDVEDMLDVVFSRFCIGK